jgi:hypothetical protein
MHHGQHERLGAITKGFAMKRRTVSRRGFIKTGLAASAAFSIPTIVPSTVLGANAPGNRVNAALIGCEG